MDRKRIVITGLGGLSALGTSAGEIWQSMKDGRPGIGEITTTPLHDLKLRIGAEVKVLPERGLDPRRVQTMDRFSLLAVLAALEAVADARLVIDAGNAARVGAIIGAGVSGFTSIEEAYRSVLIDGRSRAPILTVPKVMTGAPAGQVSMATGAKGPVFGVTSACSSGNHAFAASLDILRAGRADVMLAGGTEAPLVWAVLKAWEALRVTARETCRPFSADRDGLLIGEGAGVAVLETLEHALARGAPVLAELAGAGMTADAADIVSPTVAGPEAAIRACLADAGLTSADIDYINAHGTGTKANDAIETKAIRAVFGAEADRVSVSSTKAMHGHCLGASSALELIACVGAVRDGVIPPTIGFTAPDPECDLDVTPNSARTRSVRAALSNAFAFGGTNAVIAVKSA